MYGILILSNASILSLEATKLVLGTEESINVIEPYVENVWEYMCESLEVESNAID